MKRETENKQLFSFKKGHTLPVSDEYLDFLENCQKTLLIGNLRGMIVDNNDDGKPSFFQTTGICDKKAKMALTFYKRFSDINKFTHFLVHEDDAQYYKDFIENFALENCQIITHRLRGKSTEYKIAFVPPVVSKDFKSSFNIRNEYLQDMETLTKFKVGSDEQDKQIKYMLQKYVAICLNYTDGKLNEVYTDHGNITVIIYKDNKMFTNVYSKVNKITGEKIEIRDFDNVPKMFNARINGFKGKKTMTYDFILMNPPYNLGGKITKSTLGHLLSDNGKCVCLMPLAQYTSRNKSLELWRNVWSFELADNKMFEDASITENLCICVLKKNAVDKYTYESLEYESFDKGFLPFFLKNTNVGYIIPVDKCTKRFKTVEDGRNFFPNDTDTLIFFGVRTLSGGITKGTFDYKYNTNLCGNEEIPFDKNEKNYCMGGKLFRLKSNIAKNNFVLWAYNGELANKIRKAKNADSRKCDNILPQISWSDIHIRQKELWEKGMYDEAVLAEMGLEWVDETHTAVKEKREKI